MPSRNDERKRLGSVAVTQAERGDEGGHAARRAECFGSEVLPVLFFQDSPVNLISRKDFRLTPSVVAGAGAAQRGRIYSSPRLLYPLAV